MINYDYRTTVGMHVRELRLRAGMKQAELAQAVGLKAPDISDIELGKKPICPLHHRAFAEALQVDPFGFVDFIRKTDAPYLREPPRVEETPEAPAKEVKQQPGTRSGFIIKSGVPIPDAHPAVKERHYPYNSMQVGQSFEFDRSVKKTVENHSQVYKRESGKKFKIRGLEIWRVE